MIPNPTEIAELYGVNPVFAPPAFVVLLTAIVLSVQSIGRWFEGRNSQQK
jgi:hypothetical protein